MSILASRAGFTDSDNNPNGPATFTLLILPIDPLIMPLFIRRWTPRTWSVLDKLFLSDENS